MPWNESKHDTPRPMPDSEPTVLVVKPRQWETDEIVVHTLPHEFARDDVEVYLPDGTWLGTVSRYRGSLDRPAGRLRIPGKTRTLWSYRTAGGSVYSMFGQVSRADCIRSLVASHERRKRGGMFA